MVSGTDVNAEAGNRMSTPDENMVLSAAPSLAPGKMSNHEVV